ncbi:F-box-like domain-containing protein [Microdochium nivale]|nr:F-box-like domain-containing protein [Microdochium nivale]
MTLLTELPPEIIHGVLAHVDPQDLARVPLVCQALRYAVQDNTPLFKAVYLAHLDTPPADAVGGGLQWEQLLKDYVRLRVVCGRKRVNEKKKELPFVYNTVTALLRNAATTEAASASASSAADQVSRNAQLLASLFADETNQAAFLCRSSIYERARAETIYKPNSSTSTSTSGRSTSSTTAMTTTTHTGSGSDNTDNGVNCDSSNLPKNDHMRSAKLHCLYGKPIHFAHPESRRTRHGRMRPFACSRVYDLRQYTTQTQWGPFMDDDGSGGLRVDWEMVEAIMIVIGANLRNLGLETYPIYKNFWATPFAGVWPNSYTGVMPLLSNDDNDDLSDDSAATPCENCSRPISVPPQVPGEQDEADVDDDLEDGAGGGKGKKKKRKPPGDPYGINGTWLRAVCFLDYSDFFAYNFAQEPHHSLPASVPRPAIDVGEATRLILMKIAVTEVEEPGPEDGQGMPVVHFRGLSRSLDDSWDDNANSDLAGTVRLTKEGEVRWTTVSIFAGVERWKSESVQIGGVKSARGVLGNWFDRDYDPRGPVGPTAFWKISDRIAASNHEQRVMLNDFLPVLDAVAMEDDIEYESDSDDEEEDDDDGHEHSHGGAGHDDEVIGGTEDEYGDDDEDGHDDGETDSEDEAAQARFLASMPEIEIIDGTDIEIVGSQIIWTQRD